MDGQRSSKEGEGRVVVQARRRAEIVALNQFHGEDRAQEKRPGSLDPELLGGERLLSIYLSRGSYLSL